ncbi:phage tail protein [Vibrio navarrensis]|uniref:phage tail protein n=1 Tax=Vibrio navarrensis TaxID=29495 RepID=UPI0015590D47|nr:tail fiber protein [Vibrio navarrensis]
MSEAFYGEIMMLPYSYAPYGWAYCDGQVIPISQNQALYAVIGSYFGGNGQTTMGLPNLQGRTPISQGTGPGLTYRQFSTSGGYDQFSLSQSQIPSHTHQLRGRISPTATSSPTGAVPTISRDSNGEANFIYSTSEAPNNSMASETLGIAGLSSAHENRQPFLAINFCICVDGVFPSRN